MGNCAGDTYEFFSTCFNNNNNHSRKIRLNNKKIINKNQKTNIKNIYIIKNESPIGKRKESRDFHVTHF